MITWTIAQIALLGGLLALAAWGAESALRTAGRPTRWAWVGALVMTLVLAALTPLRDVAERAVTAPAALPTLTAISAPASAPTGLLITITETWLRVTALAERTVRDAWSLWHAAVPAGTERVLLIAWLLASAALLIAFVAVHRRFAQRRAQWPVHTLLDTPVRVADDVGPAVIGLTRAEIVVPQWLLSRDAREQQLVLTHEREHVRMHDPLLLAIAQAAIVLLPWHPAVWWMASRLRLAVELDCDRRVLQRGASARDYGTLLIDLTDHRTGFGAALPAFSCTPSHLERRLLAMTPTKMRYPLVRALSTGALASLALLAACEAKLPTNAEVDGMTAKTASEAAAKIAVVDFSGANFYVDGAATTQAAAEKLKPEQIASINVSKNGGQGRDEVHIVTRDPSQPRTESTQAKVRVDISRADTAAAKMAAFSGILILDGVPTNGSAMNTLKPDDIATVNVIKGAAATAKYSDPRAANGVIEIVTKKAAKP